jgi:pimeloyl-ACP methyl ester carboxylesterase
MKTINLLTLLGVAWLGLPGTANAAPAAKAPQPASPKLTLSACTEAGMPAEARCGTYQVFENRAAKTGRKIPLRVLVLPALGPDRLPDAVTYFAGGPGDSSVEEGLSVAQALKPLRQRRDFLFVDMRGTGKSAPLNCPELQGSAGVQGFLDDFLPADKARACGERLRKTADLAQYTTDNAVDDVDEVRAALGYPQVNVMGGSYGTRAVLVYLRRHPREVRTALLHGVVPTHDRAPLYFARSAQRALDSLVAECAADTACAAAFPDLKQEIAAVLAKVEKEPARVRLSDAESGEDVEVRLSQNGVAQTLRYMLYSPASSLLLPLEVHLAAQGSWKPLAETARSFASGMSSLSDGYYLSVTCAEDVPFIADAAVAPAVAGTFLGDFRIRKQLAACAGWPAAKLGEAFLKPVVSDVPSLLISGERDPVTPASDGEEAARTLRHSKHVVVPDAGHGFRGLEGTGCIDDLTVKLVESGSAESLDTSCVAAIKRSPFVLDLGAPEVALSRAELIPLVGTYTGPDGLKAEIDLLEASDGAGGRLRARMFGKAFILVPTAATRFRPEGMPPGYALVFERTEGPAKGLALVQPGRPEMQLVRK